MRDINANELKCIRTLLSKLKIADKDAVVLGFTGMRTTHVSEMYDHEAAAMIRHLKGLDPEEAKGDKMRKKIIAMAYNRAGLSRSAGKEDKKAVMAHLESWLLKYGYLKKKLDSYTASELPKLVTQYESVLKSDLKRV